MAAAMALEDGSVHAVRADMEVQQGSSSFDGGALDLAFERFSGQPRTVCVRFGWV